MARPQQDSHRSGGLLGTFFFFSIVGTILFSLAVYHHERVLSILSPLPNLKTAFPYDDELWTLASPGDKSAAADDQIVPWRLQVSEADLDDLKERLQKTRYGTPMQQQNFEYGFPGDQLKKVVDYWLTKYDWKKQEALINKYDHFKTVIEGLNIHFVRVRPEKPEKGQQTLRVVPIILLHGWPGSFFELYKLIPLLTKPQQITGKDYVAFEVIIPSMPGLHPPHIARIFNKLMSRLKFENYFIHGGDWGSAIGRSMAVMYPERVLGVELTMYPIPVVVSVIKSLINMVTPSWLCEVSEPDKDIFKNLPSLMRETGYMHIQGTRPDTVGAALLSCPAGLAAYILEKFSVWTDPANIGKSDGGLTEYFTMDDLLTNVMVYWLSNSIITSQRLYKETFASRSFSNDAFPVVVPTLLSDFRYEIAGANPPAQYLKPYYKNLVKVSKHVSGGHFPAMQLPTELAEDIWALAKDVLSNE